MRAGLTFTALLAVLASPAHAQDSAPRLFTQDGSWSLDYGDDYCRLAANFTNGADRIAVAMERIQPGEALRVALVGDAVRLFRRAEEIGFHYLPGGAERKLRFARSEVPSGEQYLMLDSVPLTPPPAMAPGAPPPPPGPYDRAAEHTAGKAITGFILGSGLSQPVEIRTGALGAPIQALQACTDDMVGSWGLDPALHKAAYTPARPAEPVFGWLPANTIGFGDFGRLSGGMNQIRVMVDAAGKPTGCHVHFASLDAAKNQGICKAIMDKGRFTAAKAADGTAMASFAVLSPFVLMRPMGGR
jgi:hypothetical protein